MSKYSNTHSGPEILLKIFSGPHIGAELLLKPGSYSIGRDEDCDIVLHDQQICQHHATLDITESAATLTPIEDKNTHLDGKLIGSSSPLPLRHYSIITLGTTHLAIGNQEDNWPTVRIPKITYSHLDDESEEVKPASLISKIFKTDKWNTHYHVTKKNIARGIAQVTVGGKSLYLALKKNPKYQVLALAALSLSALGIFYNTHAEKRKHYVNKAVKVVQMENIFESISNQEFKDIDIKKTEDSIFISGFVDNQDEKSALGRWKNTTAAKYPGIPIHIDIANGAEISARASTLLKQIGFPHVEVTYTGGGTLNVSGYHSQNHEWKEIEKVILNDIPRITNIESQSIEDISIRKNRFLSALKESGLKKKIVVQENINSLVVKGILSSDERRQMEKIKDNFTKRYEGAPRILLELTDSAKAIPISIKGVRGGEYPYVMTNEGAKYMKGALLPNGFKIVAIESDKIIAEKNKIEVHYPLK